jgi:hypothetical protein
VGVVTREDDEIIEAIRARPPRKGPARPGPASLDLVIELESAVGYPMPPLLRRIYLEVSDGHFGYLNMAVALKDENAWDSESGRLLDEYLMWTGDEPEHEHPPSVVPLLTWGCRIWSLVDFNTPDGLMWAFDPNARCPRHALFPEAYTLAERLTGWLRDDLPMPTPAFGVGCPDC